MKVYRSKKAEDKIKKTYDELIEAWGIPVKQVKIPTTYGKTHVNICGKEDGAPLVLFHGVGDDSALMWIYNAKALAKEFRLYAIDTIGGPGKSEPNRFYYDEFKNNGCKDEVWIDEVLDYLKLQKVNLAGVSNGAYLVQYYTLCRPERVNKTLCMAGSVPVSERKGHLIAMMKVFLPEALFPTKKNVRKLLEKMTGNNSAVFTENPLLFTHFLALMKGFNNKAMFGHRIHQFSEEEVDVIRDKCKYIIGEADPFVLLSGGKPKNTHDMDMVFLKDTGHGINHEEAELINRMMMEYFM